MVKQGAKLEDRRKNAVVKLLPVFRQYGYEGATLSRLSDATGLGRASLYHHFPNGKEEMAAGVLDYAREVVGETIIAPLKAPGEPLIRLCTMSQRVSEFYHQGQSACLLAVLSLGEADGLFHDAVKRSLEGWLNALTQVLIEAGIEPNTARERSENAVMQIQGALVLVRGLEDTSLFDRVMAQLPDQLLAKN
ncbi:MAG: TetR/AcrR family transcriptional regulator [Cyanobacteria bacterium J06635_15]